MHGYVDVFVVVVAVSISTLEMQTERIKTIRNFPKDESRKMMMDSFEHDGKTELKLERSGKSGVGKGEDEI